VNLNPNVPYASDFQSVMNYLINFAPGPKRPDKKVLAGEMDIKTDTLQRHCNGTIRSDADFARDFIRATSAKYPDIAVELLSFFIPEGFRVIREGQAKPGSPEDLREQQLDLSRLVGRIQELVKEAKADGKIDSIEHRDISRKIAALKQVAAELDERLKGEVGKP